MVHAPVDGPMIQNPSKDKKVGGYKKIENENKKDKEVQWI